MPKSDEQEILDPVVLAAMVEDPDEDEETKKLRKEILGSEETVKAEDVDLEEDEDDEEEKPVVKKKSTSDDEDQDEDEDEDDEEAGKPVKKPVEAKDDEDEDLEEDEDDEDEDDKKLSRKEKRQKRAQSFIDEIRKDGAPRNRPPLQLPDYKPVDYKAAPEDGFKPDELEEDRQRVGALQYARGAQTVKYWAEQDNFWRELTTEAKIVSYDPKLNFLTEELPDGKKNPNFDPDKTAEINEMYFQLVGLKQFQKTDAQGRPLFDRATGLPLITSIIEKPDLSYEKFARKYVKNMSKWNDDEVDERVEQTRKNITSQKKRQGIRPGGGKRKSLGALKPGDITKMSDEQLEKNEAEIERQILEML